MYKPFSVGNYNIFKNAKPLIIAEVAQAHDGSLGTAHAYIDAIADAGADAVKFQAHISDAESTYDEVFRVNFSLQDKTRFDYWKRMEFSQSEWRGLYDHACDRGLVFLCSVFSLKALSMMNSIGVPAWKLSSGELNSIDLIDSMIATGKPILASTGMAYMSEIQTLYNYINSKVPILIFQCTSSYPTPLDKVGINLIQFFEKRFDCPIGLSDHSGSVFPSLSSIAKGCAAVEVHVVMDKRLFGPDVTSSVTIDELKLIVEMSNAEYVMNNNVIDKNIVADELCNLRMQFGKSIALNNSVKKGDIILENMLTMKKPGGGIPMTEIESLVGKVAVRNLSKDYLLNYTDISDEKKND